jgi:hypothetical protein
MALRIVAQSYNGPGQRQVMGDGEARQFMEAVENALNKMRGYSIGSELEKEIVCAPCTLWLLKAGGGHANACLMQKETPENKDSASYKELCKADDLKKRILQLKADRKITDDHPAVKKYKKFYDLASKGGKSEQYVQAAEYKGAMVRIPIAHKPQDAGRKAAHTTEDVLRGRVTLGDPGDNIREAMGYVQWLQMGLIGYHLMSYLTPGTGTDAIAIWDGDPAMKYVGPTDPEIKLVGPARVGGHRTWMTRPGWIALVHELIHGWRLVTGQCVFRPEPLIEAYYEEAMTVGLPPYDGCKLTENRFRLFGGEPLRTFYASKTKVISDAAQRKHRSVVERLATQVLAE